MQLAVLIESGEIHMNNVILIGMMGCGKSTIGRKAAKQAGFEFVDMDEYIETKESMTIAEIFSQKGEDYFRTIESEVAAELSSMSGLFIASGGGVVLRDENMAFFRKSGCIVFIDRPLEDIIGDVEIQSRPLLKDGVKRIRNIYSERYQLYTRYADRVLVNDKTEKEAVDKLVEISGIYLNPHFAVLGDPIEHSKSPEIHLPVLESFLKNPTFERIHVPSGQLPKNLDKLKQLRGFSLTMPLKQEIIPYLTGMSREAELSNSVNTVVCRNGQLFGHTTDGEGFFSALETDGVEFEGKHMLILGAGGVTRAIVFRASLAYSMKIGILARNETKAQALKGEVLEKVPDADIYTGCMSRDTLAGYVSAADILVNATPQGMRGVDSQWESLDFIEALPAHALVCELIYAPAETEFLKKARKLGRKSQNGLPMLVHQALVADELYLDIKIDRKKYYNRVIKNLN